MFHCLRPEYHNDCFYLPVACTTKGSQTPKFPLGSHVVMLYVFIFASSLRNLIVFETKSM